MGCPFADAPESYCFGSRRGRYIAALLSSRPCSFPYQIGKALMVWVTLHDRLFKQPINALWNKSNGSYDIKEFGTLPLIFSTSKYFRWKFQPWPSFFPHANIPDTWKRGQLSLEQMKKMEKVKVKSHLRYLAACSVQKKRWDIWRIFFSDFRSVFSP